MMERDCQMSREMSINPRSSTITVADRIVNDLLSSVNTQFIEFVPLEQSSAVNYIRANGLRPQWLGTPLDMNLKKIGLHTS